MKNMTKGILLKCLKKDSNSYCVIRLLKRHGELEIDKLRELMNINLPSVINNLYPTVIEKDLKVALSPSWHFVLTDTKYKAFLHKKCKEYNRKMKNKDKIEILHGISYKYNNMFRLSKEKTKKRNNISY